MKTENMSCQSKISVAVFLLIATGLFNISALAVDQPDNAELKETNRRHFRVFDGVGKIKERPDFTVYGFEKIRMVYTNELWNYDKKASRDEPDEAAIRKIARDASADVPTVLDIEHWNVQGNAPAVEQNIEKLIRIVDWMHQENPQLKIGYYGLLPVNDPRTLYNYFMATDHPENKWRLNSAEKTYKRLQDDNRRMNRLAGHVDFVCPSLYTFYDSGFGGYRKYWERMAITKIEEARQYNKPVYVFLWWQFHEACSKAKADQHLIPGDFWRKELETAKKYADGAVIYGSPMVYKGKWDESMPWWKETRDFLGNDR